MPLHSPLDPTYLDAAAARSERDRTFQVCSDRHVCVKLCPSFSAAIKEETDRAPAHPMQVMARAYGIENDQTRR